MEKKDIQLIHGDCLEKMKDIKDKSIDMILCDLPYGMKTIACKWDVIIPLEPLWEQYNRIVKDNGAIVLFGSQPFTSVLITSNIKNYKHSWIWNKKNGANFAQVKNNPFKIHEDIIIFTNRKGRVNYYPQMEKGERRIKGNSKNYNKENEIVKMKHHKTESDLYYPKSILEFSNAGRTGKAKKIHPTQKPVALLEYLIKTYTNENETVLDNCFGSGSTAIACINTNRKFIGIEKDDNYFEIAVNRVNGYIYEFIND